MPKRLGFIFRLVHTIKGTCGFLGLPRLERVAHAGENVLGKLRDRTLTVTPDIVTQVLAGIDQIKAIVAHLSATGAEPAGDDTDLIAALNLVAAARRGRRREGAARQRRPPPERSRRRHRQTGRPPNAPSPPHPPHRPSVARSRAPEPPPRRRSPPPPRPVAAVGRRGRRREAAQAAGSGTIQRARRTRKPSA